MDAYGHVGFQRAVTEDGLEHVAGIEYRRSITANRIPVELSSENQISWTTVDNVVSSFLEFDREKNDGRIRVCKNYGPQFKAFSLVPVNNEANGDDKFKVGPEFFPLLHKYLNEKTNWRGEFLLPGCAIFQPFLMEWTEVILENYADILKQVEIYGAIGVSRYPYNLCSNVIKAFIELWSPLTNTLHHGGGEMSISLHDLKVIAGLPIFGIPYEEFLPTNEQLLKEQGQETPNAIISELLLLHTQMCMHLKASTVTWSQWIDFFYRGSAIYGAFGEIPTSTAPKHNKKVLEMPLNISKLGILSAFLALWLSRFLMPYKGPIVRPETFGMASLLAHGTRVSLAPAENMFQHYTTKESPVSSQKVIPYLPGILAQPQSILQARLILRADQYVRYYPNPMVEHKESQCLDDGTLPIDQLEFLLSIRSANLPIRVGGDIWVEPYHPNRFARQFGFDQGVPANTFDFNVTQRGLHGIHHFATVQASFFRHNTHARFCIPSLYREASCTWWYCSWWVRSSAPYLGPSIYQVQETLTKERIKDRKPIFIIEAIRDVPVNARGAVRVSELKSDCFGRKRSKAQSLKGASSSDKEVSLRDRDYKRAQYNKSDDSDDSDKLGTETPFMDLEVESSLKDGNSEKGENFIKPCETDIPDNDSAIELDQVDYDSPNDRGFKISYNQYWETIAVSGVTTQEHSKTSEEHSKTSKGLVSAIPQERVFSLQDLAKKIKTDAGEMTDQLARDFVIGLIKNIAQLFATASFDDLLEQQPKILKSLDMIGRTITETDPGREEVELFSNKVSQLFTLLEKAHRDKALLETIDVISLKAIAKSHDEVMNTQRSLKSKLTDALKKSDELRVKVADVIEQEAKIRARKIQLETDKAQTDEEIK
ncbi:hypothetical protein Vadar_033477 [Vaccinium darrowii]|uniref:Uncharacterized protein n=1 Tax=Vaccinium darrowii TaxID=229202 RepID=A0ACB7Z966_9ERIC|nr:hypothetical protein Vadar_033477 [Vaccinium darrowii]